MEDRACGHEPTVALVATPSTVASTLTASSENNDKCITYNQVTPGHNTMCNVSKTIRTSEYEYGNVLCNNVLSCEVVIEVPAQNPVWAGQHTTPMDTPLPLPRTYTAVPVRPTRPPRAKDDAAAAAATTTAAAACAAATVVGNTDSYEANVTELVTSSDVLNRVNVVQIFQV